MATRVEIENDRVQQAATREDAAAILAALPISVIRGIADLNYCDAEAGRAVMVREIIADKFGD